MPAHSTPAASAPPLVGSMSVWGRWARAAAALLVAFWGAQSLARPFCWDQGIFAWVGSVVLQGGLPYRDAWDIKGPVTYLVAAAAEALFGRNEWGLRALDLAIVFVGAAALAALAQRLTRSRVAPWWAALLFVLWYAALDYANSAQADGWAAVFLAVAMLAFVGDGAPRPRHELLGAALAGALIGACILIKPTYGAFLLAPAAYALVAAGASPRAARWSAVPRAGVVRDAAPRIAVLLLGVLLPVALCAIWFARAGALDALVDVYLRYPLQVYTGVDSPWIWRVQAAAEWLLLRPLAVPLPFAFVGGVSLLRRNRPAGLLLVVWALTAIANVLVQGKFYPYHWLPLYPPFALLTGIGIAAVYRGVRGPAERVHAHAPGARELFVAVAAVVVCSAALVPLQTVYRWTKVLVQARPRDRYEAIEYGSDGRQVASMRAVAAYVRERTEAGERVLFWSLHPGYNYLIGRSPPGRFAFPLPLLQAPASTAGRAYRREFLASLEAEPPAYVVALAPAHCSALSFDEPRCVSSFPALAEFLARGYRADTSLAVDVGSAVLRYDILRRR